MVLCLTLHCMYKMLVWCSVIAVVFTAIVFVYQIRQHQKHYLQPFLQRCYLRICLIPPIYSISAYIGLYLTIKKISYAPYVNYAFEVLCDFYEGYALYVFFITMALCSGEIFPPFPLSIIVLSIFESFWKVFAIIPHNSFQFSPPPPKKILLTFYYYFSLSFFFCKSPCESCLCITITFFAFFFAFGGD